MRCQAGRIVANYGRVATAFTLYVPGQPVMKERDDIQRNWKWNAKDLYEVQSVFTGSLGTAEEGES